MIKASELRIGNYFHPMTEMKESYYQGLVLTVVGILPEKAVCDKDLITMFYRDDEEKPVKGYKGQFFDYDFLHPIPLTEEWLLRFGFAEEKWNVDIFTNRRLRIWKGGRGDFLAYLVEENTTTGHLIPNHNFRYVHQLQNLYFALTGHELVLDAEKETA